MNRIDSDDSEEEEEKPKEKKPEAAEEEKEEQEEEEEESKGTKPTVGGQVESQPTNGQSAKSPAPPAPGPTPTQEPPKTISSTPAPAVAPNGLVGQEMSVQEDDEDDLLGVTDLVDYVCNNEQL